MAFSRYRPPLHGKCGALAAKWVPHRHLIDTWSTVRYKTGTCIDYFPKPANRPAGKMRYGIMKGGQGYPLSQMKSNSSSIPDHGTHFGVRAVLARGAGSLSVVGTVFFRSVQTPRPLESRSFTCWVALFTLDSSGRPFPRYAAI